MDAHSIEDQLSDRERAELAAYADGSLAPERRAAVEQRLSAEPRLRALVDEQRRAIGAVRSIDVPAPAALRVSLETQRRTRRERPRTRRLAVAGVVATAGGAVALAFALSGGGTAAPSVAQAAALSQRPPAQPAPPPRGRGLLSAAVEGVTFPDWRAIDWPATGVRIDTLNGRRVTTVFYARPGRGVVAYQIVPGDRLPAPQGADTRVIGGVAYRSFTAGGRRIVTWTRQGHTCVLSGRSTRERVLYRLASWEPRA